MRPTPAGRKALEEGRYEDVAALPSRMKQYRVARRVDGQRIRTPFCATAALAEEDFAERLERARRGTKVDAATARLLVGQYAERWIKRRHGLVDAGALSKATVENNETQLRAYILPALEYRPLSAVTGDEILEWRTGLKAKDGKALSEASKIKATATLSTMLADAVDDGVLDRSPMRKRSGRAAVPRARTQDGENLYLEPAELDRLAKAIDPRYELMVLIAGLCGLRVGECIALRGSSVTKDGDLIVNRSADREGRLKETKTYESRVVRMPDVLASRVQALAKKRGPEGRLFQATRGGSVSRTNFRTRTFAAARKAAGIRGDFTFQDLRHTAASLAISSGANIKAVQQMLGHRTAAVTLDTYAGLFESDRVSTAEGVGRLYEAQVAPGGQGTEPDVAPGGQAEAS